MTPQERKRAVEAMAEKIYSRIAKDWDPIWADVPDVGRTPWLRDARLALTALLAIADVTMKETGT